MCRILDCRRNERPTTDEQRPTTNDRPFGVAQDWRPTPALEPFAPLKGKLLDAASSPPLPDGFAIRSLADLQEPPELYRQTANRLGAYDLNYSLITPEDLEAQIDGGRWDPGGALFLFDPGKRIVGVIRASLTGDGGGYLNEVRLEPASRGKGLGAALVAAALRHLADRGVKRVDLDTPGENTAARNLALRAGFQETRHWLHYLRRLSLNA
jgi:ribosomal protein S18 acetylase RimI-like enzyme